MIASELRGRDMTIPGIAGRAGARILSKDPTGPASRLLRIPSGWATEGAGAFTADVEMLVLEGELLVDGGAVGPHALVTLTAGGQVGELRADEPATALLFTAAPVRFELGSFPGRPDVRRLQDVGWDQELPGFESKTLTGPATTTRLVMIGHHQATDWQQLPEWSERFVVDGQWCEAVVADDGTVTTASMAAGSYVSRPAGLAFDGPGAGTDTSAMLIDRVAGPWIPEAVVDPA